MSTGDAGVLYHVAHIIVLIVVLISLVAIAVVVAAAAAGVDAVARKEITLIWSVLK